MLTGCVVLKHNMLVETGILVDAQRDTSSWQRYVLPNEVLITDVPDIYNALADTTTDLVIDCGECIFADPGILSAFVNARNHAQRNEAIVHLECIGTSMAHLLRMTGLHTVFEMDEDSRKLCRLENGGC